MDNWKLMKKKGEKYFKEKDYQKACENYNEALTDIESKFDESKPELKVEAAKITSNISLMYFKLSKERNDHSLLHESQTYAKKTIKYNPKWIKGYLRLADVCEQTKDVEDILNAITVYLHDNKDAMLNDDFQSLLKTFKYFSHKTIMMLSPSWHLVKYKDNVYAIDPLGAGHFKDLQELINCHWISLKNISVLIRPGVYIGTYIFIDANIDIVGDCNIEINPTTKAIDKDPSVVFTDNFTKVPEAITVIPNLLPTFSFEGSEVSLKRISVYNDEMTYQGKAIICLNTDIKLLQCCFVSKFGIGLCCLDKSKLICQSCRSVGGSNTVFLTTGSHAKLTDCFISEIDGTGIQAKDEAEMINLKRCTITKCKYHGLLVVSGTKMAKIIDCYFEGNCVPFTSSMASIQFKGCRVLIKNSSVINKNFVGIAIDGGSGIFSN